MKFIREIPLDKLAKDQILDLEQFGFTLVYTADSVEVWAEVSNI